MNYEKEGTLFAEHHKKAVKSVVRVFWDILSNENSQL